MTNAINWFEIPATNFERAVAFYGAVIGQELRTGEFLGVPHGFFPADERGVAGAVVAPEDAAPGSAGALIYLNAGFELDAMLSRVEPAGGKIETPRTSIGPQGSFAIFVDSEGNRVGLHEPASA
ncbi:MAG TPA: VOC family protein [Herpetosiphonaceae bacterium]